MKILQINAWTGRIKDGLSHFIIDGNYDVICMQEAIWSDNCNGFLEYYADTVDKIQRETHYDYVLKSSNFGTKTLNGEYQFEIGNAILSKIPFINTEEEVVTGQYSAITNLSECKNTVDHRYTVQKAILDNGIAIVNYHGYWQKDPLGNETTISCMHKVSQFIKKDLRPTIMCGDLNVIYESPAMRELDFMRDLTKENQLKTTLRNIRFVKDVACDHILTTHDIKSKNFKAIDAPISDHQALTVEIDI